MLRGFQKINKRHLWGIFAFNLGRILHKKHGLGTPRQALIMAKAILASFQTLQTRLQTLRSTVMEIYMENQKVAHPILRTQWVIQNVPQQLILYCCLTGC